MSVLVQSMIVLVWWDILCIILSHIENFNVHSVVTGNLEYLSSKQQTGAAAGAAATAATGKDGVAGSGTEPGFVMFRGSVVDLESLMAKLEGSDQARTQLENKLADMTAELGRAMQ